MPETGTRADPMLAFRFVVTVDDLAVGGFQECSGLASEVEFLDHPEGGLNHQLHKLPGRVRPTPLRLRRGVVDRAVFDWHAELTRGVVRRREVTVAIRDPAGARTLAAWTCHRTLPSKWTGPELSSQQSQVAVETVELVYEWLEQVT